MKTYGLYAFVQTRVLAETEIINLSNTPKSIFNPDDAISEILAYFKDTARVKQTMKY
jgi:hypothetical protein